MSKTLGDTLSDLLDKTDKAFEILKKADDLAKELAPVEELDGPDDTNDEDRKDESP